MSEGEFHWTNLRAIPLTAIFASQRAIFLSLYFMTREPSLSMPCIWQYVPLLMQRKISMPSKTKENGLLRWLDALVNTVHPMV
jgi:hypothetical protein